MSSRPANAEIHDDIEMAAPAHDQDTGGAVAAAGVRPGGGFGVDSGTLLVVATLITTLSYQIGTNIPGGYWQDNDQGGHHRAGEPIMRTQRLGEYRLFMTSSWVGFGASMLLTVSLLAGIAPASRFVQGLFVLAYSSLVLTFITLQPNSTMWGSIVIWVGAFVLLACGATISYHRHTKHWIAYLLMPADDVVINTQHSNNMPPLPTVVVVLAPPTKKPLYLF
ncbi:hypothetical protein ABZP36_006171 [Zizania latifolia]